MVHFVYSLNHFANVQNIGPQACGNVFRGQDDIIAMIKGSHIGKYLERRILNIARHSKNLNTHSYRARMDRQETTFCNKITDQTTHCYKARMARPDQNTVNKYTVQSLWSKDR